MKKRLLACLLTAAMLTSLFPLPALAAEAERPQWMVTEFEPLDEDKAVQTIPQGGDPDLPDQLTARAYVIEDDTVVLLPPEETEQEEQHQPDEPEETGDSQPPVDGQEGPEDKQPQTDEPEAGQLPSDSAGEPSTPDVALTSKMVENDLEPAEEQEPDIQSVTISGVTWESQPEADLAAPGEHIYTPVLPAAYDVAEGVELPTIAVTVTAAEQTALQRVQALIDDLPPSEGITANNRARVEAQLAAIDEARAGLTDAEAGQLDNSRYQAVVSALSELDGQRGVDVPVPVDDPPVEQFNLTPGNTYWFDLSGVGIPGTVNTGNSYDAVTIPDTTLHWVPFTYVGTINAYVLNSASSGQTNASADAAQATTASGTYGYTYDHSLFIADYTVTNKASWNDLNDSGKNMIFGTPYTSARVSYVMRAPSAGSDYTGSDDSIRGTPQSNEWDVIVDKGAGYIKNWSSLYSWGQDTWLASDRAARGWVSARTWSYYNATSRNVAVGFRPVLELPASDALPSDSLKVVTLDLNGGKAGTTNTAQNGPVNIVVKSGENFTAPSSEGLTRPDGNTGSYFKWMGDDGTLYTPNEIVPVSVGNLTAVWQTSPAFSQQPENKEITVGATATFTAFAVGDPVPTKYQWQVNTGNSWEDITSATGGSYTTDTANISMNGWQYRCVASNSGGDSVESNPATLTVNKLNPTVTKPAPKDNLTYTGQEQELISRGSTTDGTMQYSLEENGSYSNTIPVGTDAGTYTVWYKVVGDDNYNDVAARSIDVTIDQKSIAGATVTLGGNLTYTGQQQAQEVSSVVIDGLYATYTVSNNQQTDAETYTLTVTGNGNFTGTQTKKFTIAKATNSITGLTCADIVFGGTPNPSATADFGTVTYAYSNVQDGIYELWNTSNSKGTWYVKATVQGTSNYTGAEARIMLLVQCPWLSHWIWGLSGKLRQSPPQEKPISWAIPAARRKESGSLYSRPLTFLQKSQASPALSLWKVVVRPLVTILPDRVRPWAYRYS